MDFVVPTLVGLAFQYSPGFLVDAIPAGRLVTILEVVSSESSRIRENSDAFQVDAPNSHESGYEETSHSVSREV